MGLGRYSRHDAAVRGVLGYFGSSGAGAPYPFLTSLAASLAVYVTGATLEALALRAQSAKAASREFPG